MEELTAEERAELLSGLRFLEKELEDSLGLAEQSAKPVTLDQQAVGRVSRVDALQQQALAKSGRRSLEVRLAQVRAALAAATEGHYGECRACDEPIGYRRLRARPESPLCLSCQGRREKG